MKTCQDCGVEKPFTDFYLLRPQTGGYSTCCRKCHSHRQSRYLEKPGARERKALADRARRYGVTPTEMAVFLAAHPACDICGSTHRLNVDHDHDTDEIRGVLCHPCNTAIGSFRENPDLIRAAIEYLEVWNAGGVQR